MQKNNLNEVKKQELSELPIWVKHEWKLYRNNVYEPVSGNVQVVYVTNMQKYSPSYPLPLQKYYPLSMIQSLKNNNNTNNSKSKTNNKNNTRKRKKKSRRRKWWS